MCTWQPSSRLSSLERCNFKCSGKCFTLTFALSSKGVPVRPRFWRAAQAVSPWAHKSWPLTAVECHHPNYLIYSHQSRVCLTEVKRKKWDIRSDSRVIEWLVTLPRAKRNHNPWKELSKDYQKETHFCKDSQPPATFTVKDWHLGQAILGGCSPVGPARFAHSQPVLLVKLPSPLSGLPSHHPQKKGMSET